MRKDVAEARKVYKNGPGSVSPAKMREALRVAGSTAFPLLTEESKRMAALSEALGIHEVTVYHWVKYGAKPLHWLALRAIASGEEWSWS